MGKIKEGTEMIVKKERRFELDVVKFFAIIFMITIHVYEYLGPYDQDSVMPDSAFRNVMEFLGGPLVAPILMFCMGIGMIYTKHNTPGDFLRRGIKLMIMGYTLNFLKLTLPQLIGKMLGSEEDFDIIGGLLCVDILTFAGAAFIIIGLLRKLHLSTFAICMLAFLLQGAGIWGVNLNIESDVLQGLAGILLPTGFWVAFPLTLWLVYPALGMVFGEFLQKTTDKREMYKKLMIVSATIFTACTVGLVYTGYDLRQFYAVCDNYYYHQTFISTIWTLPLILLAISLGFFLFRSFEDSKFGGLIGFCGANLNRIFIIQWLLISLTSSLVQAFELKLDLNPAMIVLLGFAFTAAALGIAKIIKKISLRRKEKKAAEKEKNLR